MQNIVCGDLYALWDWQWMTETPVAEWHDWWLHCTHAIANEQNGLVAWASTILFFVKIQHRFFGFEAHFCWCWGFQFATAQLEKCASISICLSVFDRFSARMRTQRERLLLKHKRYVDSTTISLCLPVFGCMCARAPVCGNQEQTGHTEEIPGRFSSELLLAHIYNSSSLTVSRFYLVHVRVRIYHRIAIN